MNGLDVLAIRYVDRHPIAAARTLQNLPARRVAELLGSLTLDRRDALVGAMSPDAAASLVSELETELAADLMGRLPLEHVAPVVRRLDSAKRRLVLDGLSVHRRRRIERAASFDEGSAGGLAEMDVVAVAADATVQEALRRSQKRAPDLPYVYVTDPQHRLVGVASIGQLGRAPSTSRMAEVMVARVFRLQAFSPASDILRHPAWSELDALPVVDAEGVLVGVLRHRTLRRRLADPEPGGNQALETGGVVALGTAYCDLLASVLVSFTTAPRPHAGTAEGAP